MNDTKSSESPSTSLTPQWTATPHAGYYINSVAISGDGNTVIAGTFFHDYSRGNKSANSSDGTFGTYCYDQNGAIKWKDEFDGYEGVYWVGISQDGQVAASGGWFQNTPTYQGFIRAYDVNDTSGNPILDSKTASRVNALALSQDGSTLVAAADSVYLFQRDNGSYGDPAVHTFDSSDTIAETISVSEDGSWFVFATSDGTVYLVKNDSGKMANVYQWSSPEADTIHSVQIAPDGSWFVVGGNDSNVYVFKREDMVDNQTYTWKQALTTEGAVYGVAISNQGTYVSGIGNDGDGGAVSLIQNNQDNGAIVWTQKTLRNPNSTSMDTAADYVTVADGHPDGSPGHFYYFKRSDGTPLGMYTTDNMSWPMFISDDGSASAAGSDDSTVYYFATP